MTDLTKSKGMKSTVRQMRGPGMNLGLKKPRKDTFPKDEPYKQPRGLKKSQKMLSGSYLPDFDGMGKMGKSKKSRFK